MAQDKAERDGATRVLIVEDDPHYTRGLRVGFERFFDQVEIIGNATNVEDAIEQVQQLCPELVLLDLHMPREARASSKPKFHHGVELIEELRKMVEDARILVLSEFERTSDYEPYGLRPEILRRALDAHANGYIAKDDHYDVEALTDIIKRTMRGETIFSPLAAEVFETLGVYPRSSEDSFLDVSLPPRLYRAAIRVAQRKTNQEIAKELVLSENTIRGYVVEINKRLGLRDRYDPKLLRWLHFRSE